MDEIVTRLADLLPNDRLVASRESLSAYRTDMATTVDGGWPIAAVFPTSREEVAEVMRLASEYSAPVVPRGGGTGLSGGAAAIDGGIVVSLMKMNQIIEIDLGNRVAVVQPGVLNAELGRAANTVGLWYAPDPASFEISSIGGNLATNAGGLQCIKFGATRESVLGLEVVLADGRLLRTGGKMLKDVAGYDLRSLFVGSEGTLGIITEATLRLRPRPAQQTTLLATFASLEDAGRAASAAMQCNPQPSILELIDQPTVAAIESWRSAGLDRTARATLIASVVRVSDDSSARVDQVFASSAMNVIASTDPTEADLLLGIRRLAHPALERMGATLLDDIAVPPSAIAALLRAIERMSVPEGIQVATYGHVGDGNMHPTIVFPRGSADGRAHADRIAQDIMETAVGLGGSVTGEHGVGLLKRRSFHNSQDPTALTVMREIKRALDPMNTLNPGRGI